MAAGSSDPLAAMSRPQIGIDRLPVKRSSNEPKEAMNCKSCRKRKVGGEGPCPGAINQYADNAQRSSATGSSRAAKHAKYSTAHVYMV